MTIGSRMIGLTVFIGSMVWVQWCT